MQYIKFIGCLLVVLLTNSSFHFNNLPKESALNTENPLFELTQLKTDDLDCSADAYWKLVSKGKESITALMEGLTDTTPTTIYHPCKEARLTVGDLCYLALEEIADFPAYAVTHIQFCTVEIREDGTTCPSYYDYIFENGNKADYQKKAKEFYEKATYRFENYSKSELTDCRKTHGITGKYKLKKY